LTETVRSFVATSALGKLVSVIRMVNENEPAAVGVPPMPPPEERERPGGRLPSETDQV
jgi:hypothetical protein